MQTDYMTILFPCINNPAMCSKNSSQIGTHAFLFKNPCSITLTRGLQYIVSTPVVQKKMQRTSLLTSSDEARQECRRLSWLVSDGELKTEKREGTFEKDKALFYDNSLFHSKTSPSSKFIEVLSLKKKKIRQKEEKQC